jgi:Mitochondrial carrier protein
MGVCLLPDRDQAETATYSSGKRAPDCDLRCQHPPPQIGCPQNHGSTLLLEGTHAHTCTTHSISCFSSNLCPIFFFVLRSLGGMCGALVTSPFDVVKTRLQSDLFRQKHAGVGAVVGDSVVLVRRPGGLLWHFVETSHIIRLRPRFYLPSPHCGEFS